MFECARWLLKATPGELFPFFFFCCLLFFFPIILGWLTQLCFFRTVGIVARLLLCLESVVLGRAWNVSTIFIPGFLESKRAEHRVCTFTFCPSHLNGSYWLEQSTRVKVNKSMPHARTGPQCCSSCPRAALFSPPPAIVSPFETA